MGILEGIDTPEALRAIPPEALPRLAEALRRHLIAVGAAAGGHFAGSLGAVELSVALHYVFDTPRDRLVWDEDQLLLAEVPGDAVVGVLSGAAECPHHGVELGDRAGEVVDGDADVVEEAHRDILWKRAMAAPEDRVRREADLRMARCGRRSRLSGKR